MKLHKLFTSLLLLSAVLTLKASGEQPQNDPNTLQGIYTQISTVYYAPNHLDYEPGSNTYEYYFEEVLSLEDWMLDETHWGVEENELQLEKWMTDDFHYLVVKDNLLEVEPWMTSSCHWNIH